MNIHFGSGYLAFISERLKTGNLLLDSKSIVFYGTNFPIKNTGYDISPIHTIEKNWRKFIKHIINNFNSMCSF